MVKIMRGIRRLMGTLLIAVTLGGAGVLALAGGAAPAYADENGSEWCDYSTGSITVTRNGSPVTSVPYGSNLTVSFTVNAACPDFAVYMSGPGFNGTEYMPYGPRYNVWAMPPAGSNSLSWTLSGLGMDATNPRSVTLATFNLTVT
jgi:hypothetical protein